jgi:hypothetical protein
MDRIAKEQAAVKKKILYMGFVFYAPPPMAYSSFVTREYMPCPTEMECPSKATHLTALRA